MTFKDTAIQGDQITPLNTFGTRFRHLFTQIYCAHGFKLTTLAMLGLSKPTHSYSIFQFSATTAELFAKRRLINSGLHSIGYMGDGFYRSKDPTNSIKVLKKKAVKENNPENKENTNYTYAYTHKIVDKYSIKV